jgi:hypothetical protein
MEVMNVPQSRSRISLAPSMVKGRGTKKGMMRKTARKAYEGEGVFDVLKSVGQAVAPVAIDLASDYAKKRVAGNGIFDVVKSVGQAVAPIAIDLASDYAKKRLSGGMALPIKISPAQKRTLKKGGAITIKPDMVDSMAEHALAMLPATAKKVLGSLSKNKGIRVALKQGEDVIHRVSGKGLFDVLKSVGQAVAPVAIDLASDYAKKKVRGEGLFDVVKSVGQAVAPIAIDLASDYAKKKVSGGRMRKMPVSGRGGSPYVSAPYKQVMNDYGMEQGGSFVAAGGSFVPAGSGGGIYPAGRYGGGVGMPIQQGSPYAMVGSPAMSPFIPTRGIQSYNPIEKKGGGPIGSVIGQVLGSFLPI